MHLLDVLRRLPRSFAAQQSATGARHALCEQRGYCGPFVNQTLYDSLAAWQGFGDCVECGRAVPVPKDNPRALSWGAVRARYAVEPGPTA